MMVENLAPTRSTWAAVVTGAVMDRRLPTRESVRKLRKFFGVALGEVDAIGDGDNYPVRFRTFSQTVEIYHRDIGVKVGEGAGEIEWKMNQWLAMKGIKEPKVTEWFEVNLVWEHLMGGGDVEEVPGGWKKYLSAEVGGMHYGYPGKGTIRKWKDYEPEEQIFIYRLVTNYWFTRAMCACLGVEKVDEVTAATMIYQLNTDRWHQKNPGEPLASRVVDIIRRRDPGYSDRSEAKLMGRLGGLNPLIGEAVDGATWVLSRMTKQAEWERR